MKTLIAILIIASFLQTTIIPLDLVLIILICRSFIREEKTNLYLAFGFGLFVSFLQNSPLGFKSIIYLSVILSTHLVSKSRFSKNSLVFIPLSVIFLLFNTIATSFVNGESIKIFPNLAAEAIICIPAFYLIRGWEERFSPGKDIKLRF